VTACVGIDASLTAAGLAVIQRPDVAPTPNRPGVFTLGVDGGGDTLGERGIRVGAQARRIWKALPPAISLVAFERLPQVRPQTSRLYIERGALILQLGEALARRGIPIVEISPGTIKKWATGDGDAEKIAVHEAMSDLWPHADLWKANGKPDDNRSDALAIATMCAQHLGWYEPDLPCHWNPNVNWPKETAHV
jgi:Holliday junction resolvasome RuvABC endonuclease subunit